MFELTKEYKIKEDDKDYKNNILASFGLEIINLLKESPIKIYSIEDIEEEKEDSKTKEKYKAMTVKAKITKLVNKDRTGKDINIKKTVKARHEVR